MSTEFERRYGVNVFDFSNYLEFLSAYVQERRRQDSAFTLGRWARALKLRDTSSVTKILNGQRLPGPDVTEKFCQYFQFKENERRYFYDLVALAKVRKDTVQRAYIMERMRRLHPKQFRSLELDEFNSIAQWHYLAVRELVRLQDFREDSNWIRERLGRRVERAQISEAIEALIRLGLLSRNEAGRLEIRDSDFSSTQDVPSEAIRRFHLGVFDRAREALAEIPVQERHIAGNTLAIRRERLAEAKALIDRFQDEFSHFIETSTGADAVYQLSVQFFPLTRPVEGASA